MGHCDRQRRAVLLFVAVELSVFLCISIERETTLCNSDAVLLQGTNIAAGKCRGVVIGTGLNTEIGESALVPAPSDPLLIRYVSHFQCNVSDPRVVGAELSRRVVCFSSRTIDNVAVTCVHVIVCDVLSSMAILICVYCRERLQRLRSVCVCVWGVRQSSRRSALTRLAS